MDRGKVVISGFYGCGNLGDEAILSVLLDRLRARWPQLQIVVLSGAPPETSRVHQVQAINRWNPFSIARELHSADLLISGGGGLLQDRTSRRSPLYYLGIIGLAQALGRPVFIVGQGLGPLKRRWLQRLAQRRLRRAAFALVRDEVSFALLQNWGLAPDRLARGGDLALLCELRQALHVPFRTDDEKPYLIVALKGPQPQSFVQRLAHALDELVSAQGLRVVFLAFCAQSDRETMQVIAQQMQEPSLLLAPQAGELRETLELIAGARFLLGMRLHALIFSMLAATPFVALCDDLKIDQFLAHAERVSGLQLPCWQLSDLERSQFDLRTALVDLAHKCEPQGNEMREVCEALRRGAEQLAAQTDAALKNCFDRMEPLMQH